MTKFQRWTLSIFAIVQVMALVCEWTWELVPPSLGEVFWVTAFFVPLPGNLIADGIVAKLFWDIHRSRNTMALLADSITIAVNAAVWFCVLGTLRYLYIRISARAGRR